MLIFNVCSKTIYHRTWYCDARLHSEPYFVFTVCGCDGDVTEIIKVHIQCEYSMIQCITIKLIVL